MDAEKFAYEMIEVPDDRLVQAIYKGMGKARQLRRRQYVTRSLTAAAAAFALLVCIANGPSLYA